MKLNKKLNKILRTVQKQAKPLTVLGLLAILASFTVTPTIGEPSNILLYHSVDFVVFVLGLLTFLLGVYTLSRKFLHEYKFSFGHLILRLLLAGILSVGFFILMSPFLQRTEGLSFEEAARIGEINAWRVVFFYGFFTGIFVFIAFWRKIFRLTALTLTLFWLIGSSLVLLISSTPTSTYEQDLAQQAIPTFTGQELFDAVNVYRKEKGVKELKLENALCSNLAQRYFDIKKGLDEGVAHKGFDEWYQKYVEPYGNYIISEDFAWGNTPQEVIKAWEGSPGHRLSILDPQNTLGCSYAADGYGIIVLGYKQAYTAQQTNSQNQVPSRTGRIITYHEWCTNKDISIYENELITKKSSDGNIYTMTQGDWDCYENYLRNKRQKLLFWPLNFPF